jgi:hypothetical protein
MQTLNPKHASPGLEQDMQSRRGGVPALDRLAILLIGGLMMRFSGTERSVGLSVCLMVHFSSAERSVGLSV